MQKNIPDWIQKRQAENLEENQKYLEQKYINLEEGTTTVFFDVTTPPVEIQGEFGKRYQYRARLTETEQWRILSASKVLDRMIVEKLYEGKNILEITRVGKGRFTRYSVR